MQEFLFRDRTSE